LTQTYDGTSKIVDVTTSPTGLNVTITYDGGTAGPVNAGSYSVEVTINENNYFGSASATLTIDPAPATVTIDPFSLEQAYDGSPKAVIAVSVPAGLAISVTYDGSAAAPTDAGSYFVEATISDANYFGAGSDTLVITPVEATVIADLAVMFQGDPLPAFTATFEGLMPGDDPSIVTSLTFDISPTFTGDPGTYDLIPTATAVNYTFISVSAPFYVNPVGPGTKRITPKIICVDELAQPDSNGFTHVATFRYINNNATDVYIPIGDDNELHGPASFNGVNQPELFLAGGADFDVPFDGSTLKYSVTSFDHNWQKKTLTATANNSTNSCNKDAEALLPPAIEDEESGMDIVAYPNPVNNRLFISLDGRETLTDEDIFVFDLYGRLSPVKSIRPSSELIEIDMSGMNSGVYIIYLRFEDANEMIRVIKQ
jgi:hypothetical protein